MLKKLAITCVVLTLCASFLPAYAQNADDAAATRLELSRRYVTALKMEATMDAMLASMIPAMMASIPRAQTIPQEKRDLLERTVRDSMRALTPKLLDRTAELMAADFSEPELSALVQFYESPVGQSIVAKMPAFSARSSALMQEFMPDMIREMDSLLCPQIGAPTGCLTNRTAQ